MLAWDNAPNTADIPENVVAINATNDGIIGGNVGDGFGFVANGFGDGINTDFIPPAISNNFVGIGAGHGMPTFAQNVDVVGSMNDGIGTDGGNKDIANDGSCGIFGGINGTDINKYCGGMVADGMMNGDGIGTVGAPQKNGVNVAAGGIGGDISSGSNIGNGGGDGNNVGSVVHKVQQHGNINGTIHHIQNNANQCPLSPNYNILNNNNNI